MSDDFQALMKQVYRKSGAKTEDAYLALFDIIPLKEFNDGKSMLTTIERKDLLAKFAEKFPNLSFDLRFPNSQHRRIDVRGSQQDLADFGNRYHGQVLGDYEVFHVDDDDQGEIVRIIKRDRL